jgi:hypothetical protein
MHTEDLRATEEEEEVGLENGIEHPDWKGKTWA